MMSTIFTGQTIKYNIFTGKMIEQNSINIRMIANTICLLIPTYNTVDKLTYGVCYIHWPNDKTELYQYSWNI